VSGPLATIVLYYRDADAVGVVLPLRFLVFLVITLRLVPRGGRGFLIAFARSDRLTAPPIDASLLCLLSLAWFQN
jgi:hypothetical protein